MQLKSNEQGFPLKILLSDKRFTCFCDFFGEKLLNTIRWNSEVLNVSGYMEVVNSVQQWDWKRVWKHSSCMIFQSKRENGVVRLSKFIFTLFYVHQKKCQSYKKFILTSGFLWTRFSMLRTHFDYFRKVFLCACVPECVQILWPS